MKLVDRAGHRKQTHGHVAAARDQPRRRPRQLGRLARGAEATYDGEVLLADEGLVVPLP